MSIYLEQILVVLIAAFAGWSIPHCYFVILAKRKYGFNISLDNNIRKIWDKVTKKQGFL